MPGNIDRVGATFASQTTLPISSGQVDAEFSNVLAAVDTAIDDISALETDATALAVRVAAIEEYDTDTRIDALEAAAVPTQHSIDTAARNLVAAGDASPTSATMLDYDNIIIYTTTGGLTFTLPAPVASMSLRTWRIVNASHYAVQVDFGLNRAGDESAPYVPSLSNGGALVVTVLPTNATGDGEFLYVVLSVTL